MDPDKGYLDVSEEKKIIIKTMTFFLSGKKRSSLFSRRRKKNTDHADREKRVDLNKNGYLFGIYSLHAASKLFSGKIGRHLID